MSTLLFILFGGLAIGCAVSMVAHRNPLYSAISLIGVFVALAALYLMLQAPFIAAVQVIVYAGAIMVLVVFVIMLLNVEEEARKPLRLRHMIGVGVPLGALLIAEAFFLLTLRGGSSRIDPVGPPPNDVGLTASVGAGLFTEYLLPFEVTSVLILMALVGAITLARRASVARPESAEDFPPPGSQAPPTPAPVAAGVLQPGDTAATGRAYARMQMEQEESGAPARPQSEGGER